MNSKSISASMVESPVEAEVLADVMPVSAAGLEAEVRVLRTIAEVEELRAVWTAWEGHPHSDIDFFLMLLGAREEILSPHVIVVYRGGKPDAMLIGRLESGEIEFKIGYLRLFKVQARSLAFPYGALRGNPSEENCKEIVRAILESLESGEADWAALNYPGTASCLYKKARSLPGLLSRDFGSVPQLHHLIRLPGTLEEVFKGFSSAHRQTMKSHGKKIEKKLNGRLKIHCFREVAELEAGISQVEAVAKKTYHRGLGVGFDNSPRSRQVMQFYARKGQLRMYVVYDGDKPIAFWVGVEYGGWFHSDHTGYDPEYRDCSPGTYLLVKMIDEFCKEGLQGIDFGLGDAVYKSRFGNHSFEEAKVDIYARRPKGMTIKFFRCLTAVVNVAAKRLFSGTDLLLKIKKRWREHLAEKSAARSDVNTHKSA